MEKQQNLVFFIYFLSFFVLLTGFQVVQCSSHHHHHHHQHRFSSAGISKLFVFGDSYVDTGNNNKTVARSWKEPYGITFPGKPAGRFSDGRVLTDYVASFIGIKSGPVPYVLRNMGTDPLSNGMNFAYGGTGVFNTLTLDPNMTTQIDFLQQLLQDGVYTKDDLNSSMALVSAAGNDYTAYLAKNGTTEGLPAFITSVVNQLALNLKRIHELGIRKVVVTALEPLGCLPQRTASSFYQQCNETDNKAVDLHNLLLQQAVEKLNNESKDAGFVILDIHGAFLSLLKGQGAHPGISKFENPLKPCCVGVTNEFSCGSVDESGVKKYTVCENPELAFFWDDVHPAQEGWFEVYSALQASLSQIHLG
ncbi:hypothetical protein HHK36_019323 [Tetracentron sinense]|uniref:Uncharacterized protein n=1 Tax=Tetracentron sinense TaxID=13715 RepID=A0A834Z209_TETSI|nr:hypothetical protein HHK36_019323 [Tetracentron sinense]